MLQYYQKHRINRQLRQQSTRGMTMIELLVVITIIMVLTAVMIPTIRYQTRNRALREAERQLIAFIGSAQARAQQLGRPVGIWIERFSESETLIGANYAVDIYIAEIPRPYTGETRNELVKIDTTGKLTFNNGTLSGDRFIKTGESFKIQFNHRDPYYDAKRTLNDDYYLHVPNTRFGRTPIPTAEFSVGAPFGVESKGVPYKIQRQPKKSFLPPLRLPAGAVIDLSVSGMGSDGDDFWTLKNPATIQLDTKPVTIMFQSDGSIDRVLYDGIDERPVGWVHLLVGRQNQVFPDKEIDSDGNPIPFNRFTDKATETANVMDMENRWVSINHRTGSITSEQVVGFPTTAIGNQRIRHARALVRTGTGSGGN